MLPSFKQGSTLLHSLPKPLFPSRIPLFCSQRFCKRQMSTGEPSPLCPKFVPVENGEEPSSSDGFKFRVVSYNILAQVYVKSSLFPHSPSPCLRWRARSNSILTVLKNLESDFLCIQELDEYESFYKGNIEGYGYSSIYIQRSGQKRDGCGIFYKNNSVELVLEEKIEYNDLINSVQDGNTSLENVNVDTPANGASGALPLEGLPPKNDPNDRGDPNDPRVRLKRDCVGIMAAFRLTDPSQHLVIVANTHLYWDPEWADVKLAQAKYLLLRLAQFNETVSNKFDCKPSVILCGDFNSTPSDKVYQYLVSGHSVPTPSQGSSEELPIPLCSVYAFIGGVEPAFTNCTPDFTDTLDYVLFSPSGRLKPVTLLELPGPESSDVVGCLPNYHHPSDHLPIGADFQVTGS